MQEILFADLGSSDYKQTWDFQEQLLQQIMQLKLEGRNQGLGDHAPTPHYLLFCEHPHVFTLGKSGKP
ncbi:MAG TPA: lipoyl(octanoyl) transferase, partial [Bacteroidia bacterium]|nr:lipoyl(octanoyl) transferase [Bacteroidia bacterium]